MFAIIYSQNTGRIRWHTDTGHSSNELDKTINLTDGLGIMKLDDSQYGDLDALQTIVSNETGLIPADDTYAVVDETNQVVSLIVADPLIDTVDGAQLVAATEDVSVGQLYSPSTGTFGPTRSPLIP